MESKDRDWRMEAQLARTGRLIHMQTVILAYGPGILLIWRGESEGNAVMAMF